MLDATGEQPIELPGPSLRQRLARPLWSLAKLICLGAYRVEFGRPYLNYRDDGTRCVVTGITLSQH